MPSANTFSIPSIKKLILKYIVKGQNNIDPFLMTRALKTAKIYKLYK